VKPGLYGAAGLSSSSTSPSPPGNILDVSEELKPPLSRRGVPPIAVTNGSLYATGHQLRNYTHFEREDDRSSQATNVRGKKESSESSADLGQQSGRERSGQLGNQT
jgi:hypothetical protein